jgi:glucose-6-phosphate isomerase
LRDGVNNFFVTFVRVLESGGSPLEVEPGVTTGDYLDGFYIGTREALYGNDRQSMTITVRRVDARTIGALIALFERAVGLYASLIHINAYHQPGVEAGKKAAAALLSLQAKAHAALSGTPQTATQIAAAIGAADSAESVYLILEHLSANGRAKAAPAADPGNAAFTRA